MPLSAPVVQPTAPPITAPALVPDAEILQKAKDLLGQIQHIPREEAYLRQLGLNPCFRNGQEALQMINNNHIQVVFGDMGDSLAHAQWVADQRLIMINQRYRGDNSPATLYAISEALYHEAGHAANVTTDPLTGRHYNLSVGHSGPSSLGDDQSSIQEELDCMALNILAHGYHEATDSNYARAASTSRLINDGVKRYYNLAYDVDPYKTAFIDRMVNKYGELSLSSPGHEPNRPNEPYVPLPLAYRVMLKTLAQNPSATSSLASQSALASGKQDFPLAAPQPIPASCTPCNMRTQPTEQTLFRLPPAPALAYFA